MIKLIALVNRKPGLSFDEFVDHYEKQHVPLIMKLVPFMSDYRRNYVIPGGQFNPFGDADTKAPYDCVTELWYPNEAAFERAKSVSALPEVSQEIVADEARFIDRSGVVMFTVNERRSALGQGQG